MEISDNRGANFEFSLEARAAIVAVRASGISRKEVVDAFGTSRPQTITDIAGRAKMTKATATKKRIGVSVHLETIKVVIHREDNDRQGEKFTKENSLDGRHVPAFDNEKATESEEGEKTTENADPLSIEEDEKDRDTDVGRVSGPGAYSSGDARPMSRIQILGEESDELASEREALNGFICTPSEDRSLNAGNEKF
ncbi:uncharacterized protein BCR38DRAFT_412565 [Pseudomassariella vexata]|uniref:Uncharacterized protein n=1 Tax=Pseudomassariella vexata TaxID=1141098 RepID=A0A1Y2DKA0_9PEZI|nr:uncharacterized protein BCR38DRAFT_412565 [Pseudomassariella vexata]ORY59556.1 hypothetical protein BCR38DRAFT_412565 [Pseudomassariella vexata]